jgi:hypothetical protein
MKQPARKVDPGPPLDTPEEELELLALLSAADIEEAKADDHMTRLGALLLAALLAGSLYVWLADMGVAGRYRNTRTGRLVSLMTVRRELDSYLAAHDRTAVALANQLRAGQITLAQWELLMRRNIRHIHLNAIALERGGWAQMRMADFQRAGRIIRDEFGFLKNFAKEIADRTQRMDGRLAQRAKLYSQAARTTFYESKQANLRAGLTHVRSIRTARDSCIECLTLNGKWFKLGDPAYKLPGRRICGRNCACYEEYGSLVDGAPVGVEVA